MELWDLYDKNRTRLNRTHVRGQQIPPDHYHLVVHIWIQNAKGEYLVSKRTPDKYPFPNLWECTGGSAVTGDDSLTAALRETKEELGVDLDPLNGTMIKTLRTEDTFSDVWLFRQEVDLSDITFQQGETCDAMWATPDDIRRMLADGAFVPVFSYLEWLFDYQDPIGFFPAQPPEHLDYSVTAALHRGQWVFVRHRERDTWELPGGHIEPGEDALSAARRELREESGATDFKLWPMCVYSVARGSAVTGGLFCVADVRRFDAIPASFEMAERAMMDDAPDNLTYPFIVHKLIARARRWIEQNATTVYFIRHAEPDISVHQDDIRPLTAKGRMDAEALVEKLRNVRFDAIFSSPYLRAEQTVLPLAVHRRMPISEVWDFRERKIGAGWIEDYTAFAIRQWADHDYKLEDGESIADAQSRNITALSGILARRKGQTIAIGTHGGCLGAIRNHYDPSFGYDKFQALLPKVPCVMRLAFVEDRCLEVMEL